MIHFPPHSYLRLSKIIEALTEDSESGEGTTSGRVRREKVYAGCMENRAGFIPIRSPQSKWYLSREELPDDDVPWNVKYLSGWGEFELTNCTQIWVQI